MNQKAQERYFQLRQALERLRNVEEKLLAALDNIALGNEFDDCIGKRDHESATALIPDVVASLQDYDALFKTAAGVEKARTSTAAMLKGKSK